MNEPFGARAWTRRSGAPPYVLGHRGVRRPGISENTLEAFEAARLEGADGVELDVRLDSNGQLIVLHDRDLKRVSAERDRRQVEQVPAGELRSVRLAHGERIPTLQGALDLLSRGGQRVNIELKHDVASKRRLVRGVAETVSMIADAPDFIVLSSFDPSLLLPLRLLLPEVAIAWLVHAKQRWLRSAPGLRLTGAGGVHPEVALLTEDAVRRYRHKSRFLGTWTVNDPIRAAELSAWGIDTIISDDPGAIRKVVG